MKIESIDEAEDLINKYRRVISATRTIEKIDGEDGGDPDSFVLIDKDTQIEISLRGLKADVLDSIKKVLNDQHEKITARLSEI